jgi:hypothetical protein
VCMVQRAIHTKAPSWRVHDDVLDVVRGEAPSRPKPPRASARERCMMEAQRTERGTHIARSE